MVTGYGDGGLMDCVGPMVCRVMALCIHAPPTHKHPYSRPCTHSPPPTPGHVRCMSVMEKIPTPSTTTTTGTPSTDTPNPPPAHPPATKRVLNTVDSMHRTAFGQGPSDAAAWLLTGHSSGAVQLWLVKCQHTATPLCCFGASMRSVGVLAVHAVPAYQVCVNVGVVGMGVFGCFISHPYDGHATSLPAVHLCVHQYASVFVYIL